MIGITIGSDHWRHIFFETKDHFHDPDFEEVGLLLCHKGITTIQFLDRMLKQNGEFVLKGILESPEQCWKYLWGAHCNYNQQQMFFQPVMDALRNSPSHRSSIPFFLSHIGWRLWLDAKIPKYLATHKDPFFLTIILQTMDICYEESRAVYYELMRAALCYGDEDVRSNLEKRMEELDSHFGREILAKSKASLSWDDLINI